MAGAINYNPSIPQSTDQISQSRPLILQNFTAINQLIEVDHATFASTNAGFHNQVTLVTQTPQPTFSGTNLGLYAFVPTSRPLTMVSELFVSKSNGKQVPMTAFNLQQPNPAIGWTLLPSGILIKWGQGNGNGSVTVNFSTAAPYIEFSACYAVQLTVNNTLSGDSNQFVRLQGNPTATGFTAWCSPRTTTGSAAVIFNYVAIGLANL